MSCDVDVRAALLQNIVVVGNGSGIKGLTERLDMELAKLMPSVSSSSSSSPTSSSFFFFPSCYCTSRCLRGIEKTCGDREVCGTEDSINNNEGETGKKADKK